MKPRTARWLAIGAVSTTAVAVAAGFTLGLITTASIGFADVWLPAVTGVAALAFVCSGALVATRVPGNPLGWILTTVGVLEGLLGTSSGYTLFATWHVTSPRPLGAFSAWLSSWVWAPPLGMLLTLVLLLFPDGKPASPRWRWAVWTAAIGVATETIGLAFWSWPHRAQALADPSADLTPDGAWGAIAGLGLLLIAVAIVAAIVSLVLRWRRASGDERQQLRWFLAGAALLVGGFILSVTLDTRYILIGVGFLAIPVTMTVAVLKFRLYDLDIVVKKTVVFAIVAAALTGLYLGTIALAVGGLVGGLLIAVTFKPVRDAARRIADRLVYGKRATPYEVLADFSSRIAGTYVDDDVIPRMAQLLGAATGADVARVWLHVDGRFRAVAAAPGDAPGVEEPDDPVEVRYHGDLLGALSVEMPPNDPLDPSRTRLIHDLAGQAGPVLANVRLIEELRASRRRIVTAQDARAKKLERDIHDGAQQQLVALAVKLRLLEQVAAKDPERTRTLAGELQGDATDALENLRDLARGIYPPLLADRGLGAAIAAQASKAALPVTVEADGVGRFPPEIEAAVYFSVLEALQNVAKYAKASRASVRVSADNGDLRFEVTDDGLGFDVATTDFGTGLQGMSDRLAAVGGQTQVRSAPGEGTTIGGRIPSGRATRA